MRDVPADEGPEGHRVLISNAAYQAVKDYAERRGGNLIVTAEQQPDGQWPVVLEDEVLDAIERHRAPWESVSDVLLRICRDGVPQVN